MCGGAVIWWRGESLAGTPDRNAPRASRRRVGGADGRRNRCRGAAHGVPYFAAIMGEKGAEMLVPVTDWIEARCSVVVAPIAGVVGKGLAAYGILQLT